MGKTNPKETSPRCQSLGQSTDGAGPVIQCDNLPTANCAAGTELDRETRPTAKAQQGTKPRAELSSLLLRLVQLIARQAAGEYLAIRGRDKGR